MLRMRRGVAKPSETNKTLDSATFNRNHECQHTYDIMKSCPGDPGSNLDTSNDSYKLPQRHWTLKIVVSKLVMFVNISSLLLMESIPLARIGEPLFAEIKSTSKIMGVWIENALFVQELFTWNRVAGVRAWNTWRLLDFWDLSPGGEGFAPFWNTKTFDFRRGAA